MSNIYPIGQTYQYMVSRAAKNRRAGKYDQAMKLLIKARNEYPENEDVEAEIAAVYDEIGCEEAAAQEYLRVVRLGGKRRPQALFHLTVAFAQHGDLRRASSYFAEFQRSGQSGVEPEMAQILAHQLSDAMKPDRIYSRKSRAMRLEQRAIQQLHSGRIHAAKRNAQKAKELYPTPQRCLLKACCHLLLEEGNDAVQEALQALMKKPVYVQALCVLADAYALLGRTGDVKRALYRAAKQANSTDSLFSVAVECAKHGMDHLTLVVTRRILKREPYHVRAAAMRACAHMNLGHYESAKKLFLRLSAIMPEREIFLPYAAMAKKGESYPHRLILAQDVSQEEAVQRSFRLLCILQEEPSKIRASEEMLREVCSLASWALYSEQAGENITQIALLMLAALDTPQTRAVLFDALLSPQLDDLLKQIILQTVAQYCSQFPTYADLGGRLVRIEIIRKTNDR